MERVLNREGIRFLFAQVYSCQIYFLNENDEAAEHKIYVRHPILLPEAWGCCAIPKCPILRPVHTLTFTLFQFSSVQSLSRVNSLQPHGLQHARPPRPSPTPRVYSNLCPLSRWWHTTISSSVVPFLLPSSVFPNIRVFSNESVLCISWPKYWSFSFTLLRNT